MAHPAAGGRVVRVVRAGRASLAVAGLLLLTASGLPGEGDLTRLVDGYLKARDARAVGTLTTRAHAEPTRPSAEPAPKPSVSVVLLPYSAAFEAELDAVKAGLRDSLDGYVQAVPRIEEARVAYERALLAAGGGELVRSEITDAQGSARLGDIPVGDWLLLAWQEGGHMSKSFRLREQDVKLYPNVPTNVTYSIVTYWRARVPVRQGETVEVTVTDRNVWMTAARQEGGTPVQLRRSPASGSEKRR
jgi:hypothetical protein